MSKLYTCYSCCASLANLLKQAAWKLSITLHSLHKMQHLPAQTFQATQTMVLPPFQLCRNLPRLQAVLKDAQRPISNACCMMYLPNIITLSSSPVLAVDHQSEGAAGSLTMHSCNSAHRLYCNVPYQFICLRTWMGIHHSNIILVVQQDVTTTSSFEQWYTEACLTAWPQGYQMPVRRTQHCLLVRFIAHSNAELPMC